MPNKSFAFRLPSITAAAITSCAAICLIASQLRASDDPIDQSLDALSRQGAAVSRDAQGRICGVDLMGCRTLVDEKLAQRVLELPDLHTLRLSLNTVSPATVARLMANKGWIELSLQDVPLTDAQFVQLIDDQSKLQRLSLRRISGISDAGLAALSKLPRLEVLSLVEMPITGKGLASLRDIPRLRSLDLRKCESLRTADYRCLATMNRLRELKVAGSATGDPIIESLAALPALDSLLIEDSPVSTEAIRKLAESALAGRLRSLGFTRCYGVTDDALQIASAIPHLESFAIRKCPVSGEFLLSWAKSCGDMPSRLSKLVLTDAFLSEGGLESLPKLAPSLRELDLSRDALSPQAMLTIAKLADLESLRLSECSLDDQAIRPLAGLKKLKLLDLSGNFAITDASAELLKGLPQFARIDLDNTSVSHDTPLFDGRTFDGWEGDLSAFRIQDGAIVGGSLTHPVAHNDFLCTKREYGNFELRLKCKLIGNGANGGIQLRSRRVPNNFEVSGYQADMAADYWGNLYDESRRNTILVDLPPTVRKEIVHADDWNDYVIRCEGPRIRFWLNGRQVVDYTEPDQSLPQTGIIGVQIHGGPPSEAWYKDIFIRELK